MTDTDNRLDKVEQDIGTLKESLASQKPVSEIVRYLLVFWLTISVLLGAFGWRQISDFDEQIRQAVVELFPRDSENYSRYEQLIADTNDLRENFEALTRLYTERLDDLERYADVSGDDFDLEGELERLVEEGTDDANISDTEWRTQAILSIRAFASVLEREEQAAPGDFVFNVAQLCRKLRQFELVETMANAAYVRDASPAVRALLLASQISSSGAGPEEDEAYEELIDMVRTLDYEANPQIVLAEAWNAAEDTRRYQVLIDALGELISGSERGEVPSIAYATRSRAMLRRGNPSIKEEALEVLNEGFSVYKDESPFSQWADEFLEHYVTLSQTVRLGQDIAERAETLLAANDGLLDELDLGSITGDIDLGDLSMIMNALIGIPRPTREDAEGAESIALNRVERYMFRSGGEVSWYRVAVEDALDYRIDVISSNGDPVAGIWSLDGQEFEELANDDDGGRDKDARIDIRLVPGVYYVGVRNFESGEGDFSLGVRSMD